MIILQSEQEYKKESFTAWYSFIALPRGWTDGTDIYINEDAFFLDAKDYNLLIAHEQGHIDGKGHTWFGVMSPYGIVRYLTSSS
jgi:hypothetical protein